MKNFEKSQKMEHVKYAIRGTLTEEANKLEERGENILKLNIGNPAVFNFRAPRCIIENLKSKHILFINGTGFNWNKQDHFRIVFLAECDKLKFATDSLKSFLEQYRQDIS